MKRFVNILLFMLATLFAGCDATIHEYPNVDMRPVEVPITLDLVFDTSMDIYQQVEHNTRTPLIDESFDLRYIVNIYKTSMWRQIGGEVVKQYVFSKEEVASWDNSFEIVLNEGTYDVVIWADYVDAGTVVDKYYSTLDFSNICINGAHSGCNDYRDAYIGYKTVELSVRNTGESYVVNMERPMAKYRFISNDLDAFISRMLAMKLKQQQENRGEDDDTKGDTKVEVDLADYYVEFMYEGYVNLSFNALLDMPAPMERITYRSSIVRLNDLEAEIGFDYVFMGHIDSEVMVSLKVFDQDNVQVAGVNKFPVPISRGKLTEVRGAMLTSQESGGVGINPDFDGEFWWEID